MAESGFEHGLLARLRDLAGSSATPLAVMSMNEIASALGMTRMTLYRKAGTRDQIVTALQGIGIDARRQPDVHERVVTATTALLRDRPIVELTLDLIASEAGCSVPAIHARFGGRQGVLIAVIERHSPLFTMKQLTSTELGMERETVDLHHDIRLIYTTLYTQVSREWRVLRSFIAEVLRNPGSEVGDALRDWYLPQVSAVLLPIIHTHVEQGSMRRLPPPFIIQMLIAPLALHIASRDVVASEMGIESPDPATTIDIFTGMFCRAVGTEDTE